MVNLKQLSRIIYDRLGGTIPLDQIVKATGIIIASIIDDLANDITVTVGKFGTLGQYVRNSHRAHDIHTGEVREIRERRRIRFYPHVVFKQLILSRKDRLSKPK